MPEIGDEFRAAREARHLSLSDVSEQLHIRSVYLEGIENQEWSLIVAPVYLRGFIRTYARFLGLDPAPAVEYFNASVDRPRVSGAGPKLTYSRSRARRRGPSSWLWLAALAAAVLVGFVGYNFFELRSARQQPSLGRIVSSALHGSRRAVFQRAIATGSVQDRSAAGGGARRTLEVRLTKTSWLSVQIDGAKRLEGTFPAGTRKAFHGKLADIRTGNAGGVELTVNGKEIGTMGHAGGVVERTIPLAEE